MVVVPVIAPGAEGETQKLVALVAVFAPTVTVIVPLVAPAGTLVVMLVAELAVAIAVTPLNCTRLLAGVRSKLVPVMVTGVPTEPLNGVKLVIVGTITPTVKLPALVTVLQPIVTSNDPVVAPGGMVIVKLVAVDAVIVAVMPLILTVLVNGVVKFVPVMVTEVPMEPDDGEKEVTVGGGVPI